MSIPSVLSRKHSNTGSVFPVGYHQCGPRKTLMPIAHEACEPASDTTDRGASLKRDGRLTTATNAATPI